MNQITSTSDKLTKKYIINRIADIPGGISVAMSNLVVGAVVPEGTPLSAPVGGVRFICKQAILLAGSTTKAFVIASGTHQFKVGDIAMQEVGKAAYAITSITVNGDGTDTINIPTALESAEAGVFIYQSSAAGATAAVLTNKADTIIKEAFEVPAVTQVIVMADAFIRADILANVIGGLYLATLAGILEIKY